MEGRSIRDARIEVSVPDLLDTLWGQAEDGDVITFANAAMLIKYETK